MLVVPEGRAQLVEVAQKRVPQVLAGPVELGAIALTALLAMLEHTLVMIGVWLERGDWGPEGHCVPLEALIRECEGTLPQLG